MHADLQVVVEMSEHIWRRFRRDLEEVTPEEALWRPVPEANNIALIVRHLSIEAGWHLASLEHSAAMPSEADETLQREIDAIPIDFHRNLQALDRAYTAFVSILKTLTVDDLERRSDAALAAWPSRAPHQLAFHQTMHLAMHWGQIRTIRNLYRTTRGEPARFVPDNPTYPKGRHA